MKNICLLIFLLSFVSCEGENIKQCSYACEVGHRAMKSYTDFDGACVCELSDNQNLDAGKE